MSIVMSDNENQPTLAELRQKKPKTPTFSPWLREHAEWLFNWKSLFWFFMFIFGLGMLWMGYSLITNSFTQLYGWDYSSQYTAMAARFWDMWHYFFKTGEFVLYDPSTFFGTDNIGSNSYYGLFDPFVFICIFFPRSAIPQMYAVAACLKGAVGALAMRAYLKYMGVSENSSRVGATAFAYCGYLNFMVGFPSTVSMCCTVPLILLGIEKVLKEKKPAILVWSLCLLGLISFFFLVVLCIFGVIYAIWRYFWTLKTRKAKDNWIVIGMGVAAFAVGLCLCSWTLLPSIRESSLSGRTTSIGMAYFNSIKTALKTGDVKTFFARMFEIVGGSNGRELQGLVSFFYPTTNYRYLPVYAGTGLPYDAWTASTFCYTPIIIFFIFEVITWLRTKQIQPVVAFALCCYLLFTTFAYYFFYAFTGDGYGRWYIVLVPLIIFTACKGLDHLKESPSFQLPLASLLAVLMTILTYFICQWSLTKDGSPITMQGIDGNLGLPYFVRSYDVPGMNGTESLIWIVIYQIALVCIEGLVIYMMKDRAWLHHLLIGFISVETIVCGNLSFFYGCSWSYTNSYLSGSHDSALIQDAVDKMNAQDDGYYRAYQDACSEKNASMAFGYNGGGNFHSLFNYGLSDFARFSHVSTNGSYYGKVYGETIENKNWSGYYNNKRASFDWSTGYRYYIIRNAGYGPNQSWADLSWFNDNVPFESELVYQNSLCRVYKSPYYFALGHAVDNSYQIVNDEDSSSPNISNFFSGQYYYSDSKSHKEIIRNEETYLSGAIFNADETSIPSSMNVLSTPSFNDYSYIKEINQNSLYSRAYKNPEGYGFHASDPGSFLTDGNSTYGTDDISSQSYLSDDGKLVWHLSGDAYMNDDPDGAYYLLGYTGTIARVYLIGDTFEDDGVTIKQKNYTLSYEYNSMKTVQNEVEDSYFNGLYGVYAPGRVKYIVYCKNSPADTADYVKTNKPKVYVNEKSNFDARYAYLNNDEHGLKNVVSSTDKFTFSTSFSSPKMVTTTLGYDAGWNCKATTTGASGQKITEDCQMYRLDGGLVGFYAPKGEATYVLSYTTPSLKTGLVLTYLGLIAFFGYEIALFVLHYKKRMKEKNLTWNEGEKDDPNEKTENEKKVEIEAKDKTKDPDDD